MGRYCHLKEGSSVDDSENEIDHTPPAESSPVGDFHEMADPEEDLNQIDSWVTDNNIDLSNVLSRADPMGEEDIEIDSSVELETLGHEVRHVFGSLVQDNIDVHGNGKVEPIVTYEGKINYKSTLVSQLVGNPH